VNAGVIVGALDIPTTARVDQRVPKKLLVENGAPTTADKRRIADGVDDIEWLAALKPTTIGVPAFRDTAREYLEIAVVNTALRPGAHGDRLAQLIHRAVPYPVFLIASQAETIGVSLVHKRWSLGESGQMVLDGTLIAADVTGLQDAPVVIQFVDALSLARQPRTNLYALYQGWIDTVTALLSARLTGKFMPAESSEQAKVQRTVIAECARLDIQMASLRKAAAKQTQIARQVELNLELKRLEAAHAAARAKLDSGRTT
jgi:hypothetical protein